jgi:hypothetical protein
MQTRNFFSQGPNFNVLVDSLIVKTNVIPASSIPPMSDVMITELGDPMITELTSDNMITE